MLMCSLKGRRKHIVRKVPQDLEGEEALEVVEEAPEEAEATASDNIKI